MNLQYSIIIATASAVMAAGCHVAAGEPLVKEMLYSCSGTIDAKSQGWDVVTSVNSDKKVSDGVNGRPPDKSRKLLGPSLLVGENEGEFYSLSFSANAPENCYWGVLFNDKDGKPLMADVYSSVYGGEGKKHYAQVIYGRERSIGIQPFFQSENGIEVSDFKLKRISPKDAAEWCDLTYRALPPLSYSAPADRQNLIPKTVKAMKSGKPWRIVMLGDSIINDTFNSNFQALLMRQYPNAAMKFICSVRGSTGCWYYQQPEQFKSYVSDQKPDLLIIGGVSHRNDLAAIRKVITLARQGIGCEILLLSGPLGEDWRKHDTQHPGDAIAAQSWTPDPFIEQQRQLAMDMQVEFLDMATPWNLYLGGSRKPYGWFFRDPVHGNDRGKQIVGRIMEAYFTQKQERSTN